MDINTKLEEKWREELEAYVSNSKLILSYSDKEMLWGVYLTGRKKGAEELLLLKHEYTEKLGYLSSNRGVLQTPVTIAMNQLDYEQRESRYQYEIDQLKKQLEDVKNNAGADCIDYELKIQHLKQLIERAIKLPTEHAHWCRVEDDEECSCGLSKWEEEARETL